MAVNADLRSAEVFHLANVRLVVFIAEHTIYHFM